MDVRAVRIDCDFAVDVANADAGYFVIEVDPLFGDQRIAAEFFPCLVDFAALADNKLALAVIAEAARFDNDRKAEDVDLSLIHN